jgi:hypothetical protein
VEIAVVGGGVRLPAAPVVATQPVPVVQAAVIAPVVVAAPYVAPVYAPKQDRN